MNVFFHIVSSHEYVYILNAYSKVRVPFGFKDTGMTDLTRPQGAAMLVN